MNDHKPQIFIGSTSERLELVNEVEAFFRKEEPKWDITPWHDNFFTYGLGYLESLDMAKSCDFAIIVVTPDDKTRIRGKEVNSARGNIIFELGYYMGALGRQRAFGIVDKNLLLDLPTDLLGVSMPDFIDEESNSSLINACKKILQQIRKIGVNHPRNNDFGKKLSSFDYKVYTEKIKTCSKVIRILHTYIYPFTDHSEYGYLKWEIIKNVKLAFEKNPGLRIELLFLNPYDPSMEVRIKDRDAANIDIQNDLLSMYGFFYQSKIFRRHAMKNMAIKIFNQMPPFAMFQLDDIIFLSFYPKGHAVNQSKWFEFAVNTTLGRMITTDFDAIYRDSFKAENGYYLEIDQIKFPYVKYKNNFYIGLHDDNLQDSNHLNSKLSQKLEISWFRNRISGKLQNYNAVENIIEIFCKKFPFENFIRYYVFISDVSDVFCREVDFKF